jgi:hypothetical protein
MILPEVLHGAEQTDARRSPTVPNGLRRLAAAAVHSRRNFLVADPLDLQTFDSDMIQVERVQVGVDRRPIRSGG